MMTDAKVIPEVLQDFHFSCESFLRTLHFVAGNNDSAKPLSRIAVQQLIEINHRFMPFLQAMDYPVELKGYESYLAHVEAGALEAIGRLGEYRQSISKAADQIGVPVDPRVLENLDEGIELAKNLYRRKPLEEKYAGLRALCSGQFSALGDHTRAIGDNLDPVVQERHAGHLGRIGHKMGELRRVLYRDPSRPNYEERVHMTAKSVAQTFKAMAQVYENDPEVTPLAREQLHTNRLIALEARDLAANKESGR